jgi:hypothetical protein
MKEEYSFLFNGCFSEKRILRLLVQLNVEVLWKRILFNANRINMVDDLDKEQVWRRMNPVLMDK